MFISRLEIQHKKQEELMFFQPLSLGPIHPAVLGLMVIA